MTCNELYKVWLFNGKSNSRIKIWDRSIADYVYDISFNDSVPDLSEKQIKELENTTVSCFTEIFTENDRRNVLIINVNKLGE